MLPAVGDTHPDTGESGKSGSQEDCSTTSEPVVERGSEPATEDSAAEVRRSVDETYECRWSELRSLITQNRKKERTE